MLSNRPTVVPTVDLSAAEVRKQEGISNRLSSHPASAYTTSHKRKHNKRHGIQAGKSPVRYTSAALPCTHNKIPPKAAKAVQKQI